MTFAFFGGCFLKMGIGRKPFANDFDRRSLMKLFLLFRCEYIETTYVFITCLYSLYIIKN